MTENNNEKPGVVIPYPHRTLKMDFNSFSQVPGEPLVHLLCSSTPVGQRHQVYKVPLYCSWSGKNKSSNEKVFEAQSHSFCTCCLRFTPRIAS